MNVPKSLEVSAWPCEDAPGRAGHQVINDDERHYCVWCGEYWSDLDTAIRVYAAIRKRKAEILRTATRVVRFARREEEQSLGYGLEETR